MSSSLDTAPPEPRVIPSLPPGVGERNISFRRFYTRAQTYFWDLQFSFVIFNYNKSFGLVVGRYLFNSCFFSYFNFLLTIQLHHNNSTIRSICIHTHTQAHTYTHTYICVCECVYTCVYYQNELLCIFRYIHFFFHFKAENYTDQIASTWQFNTKKQCKYAYFTI